jgi:hypothetical protein
MKVKIWLFLLVIPVLGLAWSCQEPDGPVTCGVEDPVKNLAWIKAEIKEIEASGLLEYSYLIQANYKGNTVFFMGSCCPFCKFALIIKDCQGNVLTNVSSDQLMDQKVIWKPGNSVCNLD